MTAACVPWNEDSEIQMGEQRGLSSPNKRQHAVAVNLLVDGTSRAEHVADFDQGPASQEKSHQQWRKPLAGKPS